MVHGILQFTPRIAFRYVLHRCESRDIRCRESSRFMLWPQQTTQHLAASRHLPQRSNISLATSRAVFRFNSQHVRKDTEG